MRSNNTVAERHSPFIGKQLRNIYFVPNRKFKLNGYTSHVSPEFFFRSFRLPITKRWNSTQPNQQVSFFTNLLAYVL